MPTLWAIIVLPAGIALLVKGADWLVGGAVALAERLGMTPLIVGLTVVAMGTSAPEVAASIAAALAGSGDIAVGNVYGSNIANLALVGGLCAVIRPITVQRSCLRRDIPLMLAATFVLWPVFQNGAIFRHEAIFLLILFAAILTTMIYSERRRAAADRQAEEAMKTRIEKAVHVVPARLGTSVFLVIAGLACLAVGAHLTVLSASSIGRVIGLSEGVIGLTIVAVGTSLPELMTCLVAAVKGQDDLSIGNLVGSNIFNALLVIGAAGAIKPFAISSRLTHIEFWPMMAISVVFAVIALTAKRISQPAGLGLFIGYGGYIAYLLINR